MKRIEMSLACCMMLIMASEAGAESRVSAGVNSFSDNDGTSVSTYVLDLLQSFGESWNLRIHSAYDRIDLPALPGLPGSSENIDAITAASRPVVSAGSSKEDYGKGRREVVSALDWSSNGTRLGVQYYNSQEIDFVGQQVSVSFGRDLFQRNTYISMALAHGFDDVRPVEHANGTSGLQQRSTEDLTLVWTQTVNPKTLTQLGFETTWVNGYQSNPYRQVYAGGDRHPETHPQKRFRRAVFAQVDRYLMTRASVSLLGRYYNDDWGVSARSIEARLHQYVGENVIIRYRYRYHTQGAARFYRDLYESASGIDGFLTADYKLNALQSNLFGAKITIPMDGITTRTWIAGLVMDMKYERYFDSRSFAANVFETGFTWPF